MRMRALAAVMVLQAIGCGGKKDDAPAAVRTTAPAAGSAAGSAADITEDEYAKRLIAELQKHGGKPALHYDAAHAEITDGEMHVATRNLYAEYLKLPADQRAQAIAQSAATFSEMDAADKQPLSAVRAKLLPAVRAGMYFDFALTRKLKTSEAPHRAEYVPIGEMTGIGVAVDLPTSMQIATDKQLQTWGLSLSEALAIATQNLTAQGVAFQELQPGIWTSPAHDNYDASRLLLVDEIKKLKLKGTPVAVIPNRDTLYLVGSDDAKALLAMADLADKAAQEPRPIHTVPLCLSGTTWSECEPAPTPAVKQRMHALAASGRQSLYEEQHDPLQEQVGEDVFVAKLFVIQDKKTQQISTYATWTRTVPTLLPRADFIALMQVDDDKPDKAAMVGMVPWDRFQAVMGARLKPDGRSPARWATGDAWPTAAELTKLAPTKNLFGN